MRQTREEAPSARVIARGLSRPSPTVTSKLGVKRVTSEKLGRRRTPPFRAVPAGDSRTRDRRKREKFAVPGKVDDFPRDWNAFLRGSAPRKEWNFRERIELRTEQFPLWNSGPRSGSEPKARTGSEKAGQKESEWSYLNRMIYLRRSQKMENFQ